jgi:UDP-N-acetylmuramoylalanine--D-glutamate ligase
MLQTPKLKELSFLVYGLGISGKSVIKFFKKNKVKKFEIWDDNQKNLIEKYKPKNLKQSLDKVDYIVLSPGISLIHNKNLKKFKKKIITDIDLFYLARNKFKSIVVTGTNGKSTTCKLIYHLLRENKYRCFLGGNIGNPILDIKYKKNSYVIIEASSFQLSHSKFINPNFAFFLNLTNDHLDWHGNMNNYLNSKLKIFKLQSKKSYAIINKNLKKKLIGKNFLSKIIIPKNINYQKIKPKIKNDYLTSNLNDENMSFIYTFSNLLKIKDKSFISSMKSFKGLPHRFEIFYKKKDITFINDSKATSFKATELALASLENIYWILGGLPKKKDKILLSKLKKKITKCYIIGKNINFFKKQIEGKLNYTITKNLNLSIIQILKDCKLQTKRNKFILLSPAAASFDQFKDFKKRGDDFKKLCKIYARKFI